ncbi:hypothetical protein V8G54_005236 [Vigna mungo]|uniref:Uncharacterized protein n=1 Tax=Vigna mungo TaxID=3915 RepID=A0AAQ3PJT7_VIGMU
MEVVSVQNAPCSSVENGPCEREVSPRKKKARAIAVAFERMRKCEGKRSRDGRKLRNAGEVQVSIENEVLNDNNAGKELCSGVPRKDGERQTQIPQESPTIHVDREITSSANFHKSSSLLNHQVEKDHVGGLGLGSVHNVTFQSTTKLSDSFSNFDSAANPQLKEEVISLKEKLATVEENFKTLKSVMLRYIEMKEGHIPSELITIFGDTTVVAEVDKMFQQTKKILVEQSFSYMEYVIYVLC